MKILYFSYVNYPNFEGRSKTKKWAKDICRETLDVEFERDWPVGLDHGCANHDTEGKRFKFPHPLLWRNEASLLVQWRTLNACFCTLCAVGAAVSASLCSIRCHTDVVDSSSGTSYVTKQWHNVPLLRIRGLDATLGDEQIIKSYFSSFRDFTGESV